MSVDPWRKRRSTPSKERELSSVSKKTSTREDQPGDMMIISMRMILRMVMMMVMMTKMVVFAHYHKRL